MNPGLITDWTEHDNAVQKVLLLATHTLRIFDKDLTRLRLEKPENVFFLRRFLSRDRQSTLTIIVRDAEPFRRNSPRLMALFSDYPHAMQIYECPPSLATGLKDNMLLSDTSHALIRFHEDHARSRTIIDNMRECRPYILRFEEIIREGNTALSPTTLGL